MPRPTILNTDLVKASTRPAGADAWELTTLDRAVLRWVLRGTWAFPGEPDLPRIRGALAELVALYPHLGGRLRRGRALSLEDDGVSLVSAAATDLRLADLRAPRVNVDPFSTGFSQARFRRGRQAPLLAQVTRLADGWVLGVRCSHACLDGHAFYGMVRDWGRLARGEPVARPVLDQTLTRVGVGVRTKAEAVRDAEAAGWVRLSILGLLRVLPALALGHLTERAPPIHLAPDALDRLRTQAAEASGCPALSTYEAVAAHATRLLARLHHLDPSERCTEVSVVDGRGRLPAVPEAFAGNASFACVTPALPASASLGEVAAAVHRSHAPLRARPAPDFERHFVLAQDLMAHRAPMLPFDLAAMHGRRPTVTYVNSFAKMPIYEVDFGEAGRPRPPVIAFPHLLPDPVLLWPAPPDRGGLELHLTGSPARALARLAPEDPWWETVHDPTR